MRKARFTLDPVLVIGTVSSVGIAVFFYRNTTLAPAFATFAGLLGGIITLQVQILLRDKRRAEYESRMGTLIKMIEGTSWLPDIVESMLRSATRVEREYAGTPAVDACKLAFEQCRGKLTDLEHGRFQLPYNDNSLALQLARNVEREMLVTSVPAIDLEWWDEPEGRTYWDHQLRALREGREIRRVFIHNGWSDRLDALARTQKEAGVKVRRVHTDRLPANMRVIIGLWDGRCGHELNYNASGEAVLFSFTVAPSDLARLRQLFEFIERTAVDLDEEEPGLPAATA